MVAQVPHAAPEAAVVGTAHAETWKALIHKVMYLVARTFDFQTFNKSPGPPAVWVPATATVAADHLCQLIITDGMLREVMAGDEVALQHDNTMRLQFAKAAWRLHATIFLPYRKWASHVRVEDFPGADQKRLSDFIVEFSMIRLVLLDLSLYFAIWTEAANVKHMPEGMWFIFWALRHSTEFNRLTRNALDSHDPAANWVLDFAANAYEAEMITKLPGMRLRLRNEYADLIQDLRTKAAKDHRQDKLSVYIRTDTLHHMERNEMMLQCVLVENRNTPDSSHVMSLVKDAVRNQPNAAALNPLELEILLDLIVYGDGGEFSRRIITPIFQFLAFEIDKKGGTGKEPVLRITYDDANESFIHPGNVENICSKLGVRKEKDAPKAFEALWKLGSADRGAWDAKVASKFYRDTVFKKTYQERRTWFAFFRANFRVISFHVLLFHTMLVVALLQEQGDWHNWSNALTSVIITHAALEMIDAYGGAYIQWTVAKPPAADKKAPYRSVARPWLARVCCCLPFLYRRKREPTAYERKRDNEISPEEWDCKSIAGAGSYLRSLSTFFVWFVIWALVTIIFILLVASPDSWKSPLTPSDPNAPKDTLKHWLDGIWRYIGPIYPAVVAAHWLLTMRDGYITGVHTVTDGAASCWTWFLTHCCGGFDTCFAKVVKSNESFLYTRPSTGWLMFLINVLFWLFVLAGKIAFDYFFVVKNLAAPLRQIVNLGYLSSGSGDFPGSKLPYPDADFILVAALCLPALLIVIVDTGVFYQVGVFVYGCANGLLRLNLGLITDWSDVIKEYTYGVEHFYESLISSKGKEVWMHRTNINNYYNKHLQGLGELDLTQTVGLAPDATVGAGSKQEAMREVSNVLELARWTTFADCWDHIVEDMRENDTISNAEADDLRFKKLTLLKAYGIRPLVLPCIFYAGKIQAIMDRAAIPARGQVDVLREMYLLFLVLLKELSIMPTDASFQELASIYLHGTTMSKYHAKIRESLVGAVRTIITHLSQLITDSDDFRKKMSKLSAATAAADAAYYAAVDSETVQGLREAKAAAAEARAAAKAKVQEDTDALLKKSADSLAKHTKLVAADVKQIADFAEIELEMLKARSGDKNMLQSRINAVKKVREKLVREGSQSGSDEVVPSEAVARDLKALYSGSKPQLATVVDILRKAMTQTEQQAQPRNREARRLLRFFMASLFNPQLRAPAPVELMMSLTTLVPHYAEDVIYALDADAVQEAVGVKPKANEMTNLVAPTGYQISTIDYLRIVSKNEWDNFVERILEKHAAAKGGDLGKDRSEVSAVDFQKGGKLSAFGSDLMMWASQRGQLLARTTRGMLLYQKALRVLAVLENPFYGTPEGEGVLQELLEAKFRHIVSSQVYGAKKASGKAGDKWLAHTVDKLMQIHPTFRVAYIDSQKNSAGEQVQYSVLLRNVRGVEPQPDKIQEVYRVRLPIQVETHRGVVLGEGKPENQNHAAIFCFGEAIQTVDMNQDNCLAEALKMRNLLREFEVDGQQRVPATSGTNVQSFRSKVSDEVAKRTTALVGFREYIFSNTAGSIGAFAAGAEFAFGTIVQRTMANPGNVRFHYGHPDVWNKLFTMTRGGVSKATRAFHISEDVFGGYNTVQRGARIKYREYISVGKGRDVGFEQINGFEAKVAGGNGEQAISRDVYRLGTRLDWFRLMSWYHSGIGFFMNTALLMSSIYVSVWVLYLFALATKGTLTVETGNGNRTINDAIPVFNSIQILQIGFLSILPYFGELSLEEGLIQSVFSIARQMVAGSILFFIFRQQTSAHFFVQDVYYGGASYVATGRGFALTHTPFVSMFSNFGRSHIYFGFQLGLMAFVLAFLHVHQYGLSTWGTWLVSLALFFGPFWFNPLSFRTSVVYSDYVAWRSWMKDNRDPDTKTAWYTWHSGQLAKARNTSGLQTDHGWNRLSGILMQTFNVVIVMACFQNIDTSNTGLSSGARVTGIVLFEVMVALLPLWAFLKSMYQGRLPKTVDRVLSVLFTVFFLTMFILYVLYFGRSSFEGLKDVILLMFANFTILVILVQLMLYGLPNHQWAQDLVDQGYQLADNLLGFLLFAVLFFLSLFPFVGQIQATLLFNFEFVRESESSGLKQLIRQLQENTKLEQAEQPKKAAGASDKKAA